MFEFQKTFQLLIELHKAIPHYSANEIYHRKYHEKKNKQQKKEKQKIHGKTQYLNLNAPRNHAKLQTDKTLTTQIYFVHTKQQMKIFFNETRSNKVRKWKK